MRRLTVIVLVQLLLSSHGTLLVHGATNSTIKIVLVGDSTVTDRVGW